VLSYLVFPKEELLTFLSLPKGCRTLNLGDLNGAKENKKMLEHLPKVLSAETAVILFVSAIGPMDNLFKKFMLDLRQLVGRKPGLMVILTHLDRLREQWSGDVAQIAMQKKGWHIVCAAAKQIKDFDHELPTVYTRKTLQEQLSLFLGDSVTSAQPSTTIHLAKKFDIAARYIREAAKRGLEQNNEDEWRKETVAISKQLRDLYDRETTILEKSASKFWESMPQLPENLKEMTDKLKNMVPDLGLEDSIRKAKMMLEIFSNLPSRWGVGGALAGLCAGAGVGVLALMAAAPVALPFALPVAMYPVISGPLIGAGIGASLPVAWKKLFRSTANAGTNESSDAVEPIPDLNLDDFTRAAILLALVLELQGNSIIVIAEKINSIGGDLQNGMFGTFEEVDCALKQIPKRLYEVQA